MNNCIQSTEGDKGGGLPNKDLKGDGVSKIILHALHFIVTIIFSESYKERIYFGVVALRC